MKDERLVDVHLSLTLRQQDTLGETIEIALGEATDALVTHRRDDGPQIGDPPDMQAETFALQMDLIELAEKRLEDLQEIAQQLEERRSM